MFNAFKRNLKEVTKKSAFIASNLSQVLLCSFVSKNEE